MRRLNARKFINEIGRFVLDVPGGNRRVSILSGYGVAVLCILVAFGIRYFLNPILGYRSPFILFVPAVIIAAWRGGIGPAILAVLASFFLTNEFFLTPDHSWNQFGLRHIIAGFTYVFSAVVVVGLMNAFRREQERALVKGQLLAQEKEKYRSLYSDTPVMMHSIDPSGRILSVSNFWLSSLGYKREEVIGRKSVEFLTPESQKHAKEFVLPAFSKSGLCQNVPYQMVKKNGEIMDVLLSAIAEKDAEGKVARSLAVIIDVTAQKKAEEALRNSETKLRILAETAVDAIVSADARGDIVQFNQGAERIFGYPAEEVLGQPIPLLMPAGFREHCTTGLQQFLRSREAHLVGKTTEMIGLRKDGTEFPLELSLSAWEISEGKFFTAILRDITSRKELEETLREREEFFRLISESVTDLIAVINREGKRLYNSPSYARVLGDPATLIGTDSFAEIHPDDRESIKRIFEETVSTGIGHRAEFRFVSPDGTIRFVESQGSVIKDKTGEVSKVVVVSRDMTERKQAEEQIRQNEELLRTTTEGAHVGLWSWDILTDTVEWNPVEYQQFGLPSDRKISLSVFLNCVHPDDRAKLKAALEECLRDGSELNMEHRILRPDGSVCWNQCKGRTTYANDGHAVRLSGMSLDITERKQTEEALRRSEEMLRTTSEGAGVGLWSWDILNNFLEWNPVEYQQCALPLNTPMNFQSFLSCVHPEDRDLVNRAMETSLRTKQDLDVEYRVVWPDHRIRWRYCKGRPAYANGRAVRLSGMSLDITERKHAEEVLRQQAELLNLSQVLVFDLDDKILFWNRGMEGLYGWIKQEAIGKNCHELLRTEFPYPLDQIKEKLFQRNYWEGELVHFRKDGEKLFVASHWAVYRDAQNRPVAILQSDNNITDLKKAEDALQELKDALEQRVQRRTDQLQRSLKDMESFCYTIAHDLRAPLRAMSGFSNSLAEDYKEQLDETGRDYCERIHTAASRMSQLISDLLVYGRLTHRELPTQPVDLTKEIDKVLERTAPQIEERHADIEVDKPLPKVCADAPVLDQILENLIINAVKFVPAERQPHVHIYAEHHEKNVRLCVEDNGIGIPPEYRQKIFRPFERLQAAIDYPGTGIGLAIVQRGVEKMGGEVGVESVPNQGSRFWIELPERCARRSDPPDHKPR